MNWHKIMLTDEEVSNGEIHKIMKIFYDILNAFGANSIIGVVMFEVLEQGTHFLYFTPDSQNIPAIVDLINIYPGKTCGPPFKGNVRYIAGDAYFATKFL